MGEVQQKDFEALKKVLTAAPILARPEFELPFRLQTDTSSTGLGTALTQVLDSCRQKLHGYWARMLGSRVGGKEIPSLFGGLPLWSDNGP